MIKGASYEHELKQIKEKFFANADFFMKHEFHEFHESPLIL